MRLTITIQRSTAATPTATGAPADSAGATAPTLQPYRIDVSRGLTVLDALIRLKNEEDGTLGLRYSCRSAICGSCAMTINGTEKLACRTSLRHEFERHGQVVIGPLRNLPVLKDLAVDMRPFWGKVRAVTPWVSDDSAVPRDPHSGQLSIRPASAQYHNVDACIMCGACVAACTTHEVSKSFLGPAALAKADRIYEDPRVTHAEKTDRLNALQGADGIWDCTRCNFCVQVCPKDVQPMEAIIRLRRGSLERQVPSTGGARHIQGFVDLVERYGRLNEALMPLKVVGFEPRRLLSVLPLGLRMLVRGKVPNPLGHTVPGIEAVRAIFRTTRAARRASSVSSASSVSCASSVSSAEQASPPISSTPV